MNTLNRKEFEAKITADFPNLFSDMRGDPMKTCMAWGIDTGPGWYDLIYQLSEKLEAMIVALPEDERMHYKASQVKEKFGGLRFYMWSSTKEMEQAIDEAEDESLRTCESCGQPGKTIGGGWIYTTCQACAKEQDKGNF
jgi:hypothetical protein